LSIFYFLNIFRIEPISFYLKNLFLNFNIAFILAIFAIPFCIFILIIQQLNEKHRKEGKTTIFNKYLSGKNIFLKSFYILFRLSFKTLGKIKTFIFSYNSGCSLAINFFTTTTQRSMILKLLFRKVYLFIRSVFSFQFIRIFVYWQQFV
jgi:hypothetical protein